MGILIGGTPEFLMDQRKGLYSYEALHSRLAENTFAQIAGVTDYAGPVLILKNLSPEEIYVLLCNIRNVFALGNTDKYLVPDEALTAFLRHCSEKVGDAYFRTPRNTIKSFVDLLSVLEQNPELSWMSLIGELKVEREGNSQELVTLTNKAQENTDATSSDTTASNDEANDDELTSFTL